MKYYFNISCFFIFIICLTYKYDCNNMNCKGVGAMIEIRKARAEDSRGIIEVNVKTWCTTYEGIMPSEVLQHKVDTMEEKIKKCERTVEADDNVYVALKDGDVVGIMSYGPCKDENYKEHGEIYSLYVLKEYQGQKIGKSLFLKGVEELKNKSYENMIINCLTENPSNQFYLKMGGNIIGQVENIIGGKKLSENVILYSDLKNIDTQI